MAISGASAVNFHAASSQSTQSLNAHKQGGRHPQTLTDIDAAGSSMASPPSPTGKIGSRIDITA
jgi:hypothetical protein